MKTLKVTAREIVTRFRDFRARTRPDNEPNDAVAGAPLPPLDSPVDCPAISKPETGENTVNDLPTHVAALCEYWVGRYRVKHYPDAEGNLYHVVEEEGCCDLCACLFTEYKKICGTEDLEKAEVRCFDRCGWIIIQHYYNGEQMDYPLILFQSKESVCPWGIFPTAFSGMHPLFEKIHGKEMVIKVNALVHNCNQSHNRCGLLATPFLPKRVIDISHHNDHIKLVEPEELRGKYICLSHCWGLVKPLTTTSESMSKHFDRIPPETLPKLFLDVIELARGLGIRYVWIDTLCIIQDDHADWVAESMKMCAIYENSYLTVCALTAHNCSESLWDLSNASARHIEGRSRLGVEYSWTTLEGFSRWPFHAAADKRHPDIVAKWPLMDRAWAFQERMLPSRVLYFSRGEVQWQCESETFCECNYIRPTTRNPRLYNYFRGMLESKDRRVQGARWRDIISEYSVLRLSKSRDKLPAISGLAHKLSQRLQSETYYAGLWSGTLVEDLLWFVEYYNPHRPLSPSRGPSWSWAVTNSAVFFATGSYLHYELDDAAHGSRCIRLYMNILDCQCDLLSSDPMGEVVSGSLKVQGRIFGAEISISEAYTASYGRESLILQGNISKPFLLGWPEHDHVLYLDDFESPLGSTTWKSTAFSEIACLPLARVRTERSPGATVPGVLALERDFALVLARDPNHANGYKRIGMICQKSEEVPLDVDLAVWGENMPFDFQEGGQLATITIY